MNKTKLMTISILAISIISITVFAGLQNENALTTFILNPLPEKTVVKDASESILEINGKNGVSHFIAPIGTVINYAEASSVADTMFLTDEPGVWFRSAAVTTLTGVPTPVTAVSPGQKVEFDFETETDATHTVTLLVKPTGSTVNVDFDRARSGAITVEFDVPGVYLFACKVHPYMLGVVGVVSGPGVDGILGTLDDPIPAILPTELPAVGALGLPNLSPAAAVHILTSLAPDTAPLTLVVPPLTGPSTVAAVVSAIGDKLFKWDILSTSVDFDGAGPAPAVGTFPSTPGIGEVWVNTQFEKVPGQTTATTSASLPSKPGSITVVDVSTGSFGSIIQEINAVTDPGQTALGQFNNPHNMWTNSDNDKIYNGNWFGQWLQRIDRVTGDIETSLEVGPAPTHIVTMQDAANFGKLTLTLSGSDEILIIVDEDPGDLVIEDEFDTGFKRNHPHGQWIAADGKTAVIPNVFQDEGLAGSISVMDMTNGDILFEVVGDPEEADPPETPFNARTLLPVAAGLGQLVPSGVEKAYISNIGSGTTTVIDLSTNSVGNIAVTTCPLGASPTCGPVPTTVPLLTTLRLPIQTPVSPDGKFVVAAIFSLVSGLDELLGLPVGTLSDQIVVIDTATDTVTAVLPCPAGCHGVNWGAKKGGGYYAYVTPQHSNVLIVVDPDPNGAAAPNDGSNAAIVGIVLLDNGTPGIGVTDGTGGQGVKPVPNVVNGWIQHTASNFAGLSTPVKDFLCDDDGDGLNLAQRDPNGGTLTPNVAPTVICTGVG